MGVDWRLSWTIAAGLVLAGVIVMALGGVARGVSR